MGAEPKLFPEGVADVVVGADGCGGGSAWESNQPRTGQPPCNGFEDRGSHRAPSTPDRQSTPRSVNGTRSELRSCRASALRREADLEPCSYQFAPSRCLPPKV